VETDCLGIRLLFTDLIHRPGTSHAKLVELAKTVTAECLIVSAVVCGKFLSVTDPPDELS
jgi:hypothetical protein